MTKSNIGRSHCHHTWKIVIMILIFISIATTTTIIVVIIMVILAKWKPGQKCELLFEITWAPCETAPYLHHSNDIEDYDNQLDNAGHDYAEEKDHLDGCLKSVKLPGYIVVEILERKTTLKSWRKKTFYFYSQKFYILFCR